MFSKPLRSLFSASKQKSFQRSYTHQSWNSSFKHDPVKQRLIIAGAAAVATGSALIYYGNDYTIFQHAHAKVANIKDKPAGKVDPKEKAPAEKFVPPQRDDLPTYKLEEIKKHGKDAGRIWVVYKNGVYDITEFLENHPGGEKILLAAGGSVEPFWALYAQHKTDEVMEILEKLRIGNVDKEELEKLKSQKKDSNDPYAKDPHRHPALIVNQETPFNAEAPPSLLMDHFLTPPELFFVRNHMPVPDINEKDHRLSVEGMSIKKPLNLNIDYLKKNFEEASVTTAIQCAGNRRADMNRYKKVQGLEWEGTAISNAKWTGVRLRDVLIKAGVDPNDNRIKHVHFEGADTDPEGSHYGGSIPFAKAMQPEVIIAYKMNGEAIPRDHGHPLRLIAPGIVGARQVKYLQTIRTSDVESPAHWQQKDYKAFPSSVQIGDPLDWSKVPSINEYPIQSYICVPAPGVKVRRDDEEVELAGYAWSGGGRGIIRVEVSTDGGKTWQLTELTQDPEQELDRMWAWTLWKTSVKIPKGKNKFEVLCKATDRAYNTQPETPGALWNVRGLLNNSWHKVNITVVD